MSFSEKFQFSRKQVVSILVIALILSSSIVFIGYQSRRNRIKSELEHADFIVTQFDVINATSTSLLANGSAEVGGSAMRLPDSVQLLQLTLTVFNDSEKITTLTIPINNTALHDRLNFEISIPIQPTDPSSLTASLLTNLLLGRYFSLDFNGVVKYKFLGLVDQISFTNILQFDLDQPSLTVDLLEFKLPEPPQTTGDISFDLFNPFSLTISLEGNISVLIDNQVMGIINITRKEFVSGQNNLNTSIQMLVSNPTLFSTYLMETNQTVTLLTDLQLSLSDISVNVSPTIELSGTKVDFDISITAINDMQINTTTGDLRANLNASIVSHLPIGLNISYLSGDMFISKNYIGSILWQRSPIYVQPEVSEHITGIQLNSTFSNLPYIQNLQEQFSLKNIQIGIYIDGMYYSYVIP